MKIDILGVKIDNVDYRETVEKINEFVKSGRQHQITTVNAEFLMLAQKDKEFFDILNKADLLTADGIGVLWAAKYLSLPLGVKNKFLRWLKAIWQAGYSLLSIIFYPRYCRTVLTTRVAGADLIWKIAKLASEYGYSLFLLGAAEGVAKKAATILKNTYPKLKIAGTFSGRGDEMGDKITTSVVASKTPDILFVAYGVPKQEKWIKRNLSKLPSVKVAIGVGGSFDFIVGSNIVYGIGKSTPARRAPKIIQELGLEWFWRLITQPRRWKRIWVSVPLFIWFVIKWKVIKEK